MRLDFVAFPFWEGFLLPEPYTCDNQHGGKKMTTSTTIRKATAAVAALLVLLCLLTAFSACVDPDNPDGDVFEDGASMTLVIAEDPVRTIEVDLGGLDRDISLLDVFDKEDIDHVVESGKLYKVGSLEPTAPEYIYLYTSVTADFDVSQYATTIDVDGKTLTNSGVGAADMTIEDGCVIYVGTIVF